MGSRPRSSVLCRGEDAKQKIQLVASQQAQQVAAAKASAVKLEGVTPPLPHICRVRIMQARVAEARHLFGSRRR